MKFYCFGPRGSLPAPSLKSKNFYTDEFGGNTTCYYLQAGGFHLIFDMGSGAKNLGDYLMKNKVVSTDFVLLISHYHSDHTQGMGFHIPFYLPQNRFHVHGFIPTEGVKESLKTCVEQCLVEKQGGPFFPVPHSQMPAQKSYYDHSALFSESFLLDLSSGKVEHKPPQGYDKQNPQHLLVTTIPLNHPQGCLGYRIDYLGKSLAFCTDNEPLAFTNKNINTLAKDVDLIVLDGQYTKTQLAGFAQGFGHGNPELCVDQAKDCGAKKLIIHHHDPSHDDNTLKTMEKECQAYASTLPIEFAKEGTVWDI